MSSDHLDENGKTTCLVCRKKKDGTEVSLCQGCMKFACDGTCGTYSHKDSAWLCKKCQGKSKK